MPDAGGNIRGISLGGKAGDTLDRIFGKREPETKWPESRDFPDIEDCVVYCTDFILYGQCEHSHG